MKTMEIKLLDIRDAGTFIPAMAIQVRGTDGYLLRRAGFGDFPIVILIHLQGMRCSPDAYGWSVQSRTMPEAHKWIEENWEEIEDGAVVDVQFILGETQTPKISESLR